MLWLYLAALNTPEQRDKLTEIYAVYKKRMYYEALHILKDAQLAEDAVHNSFLTLIKKIDDIRTDNCNQIASFVVLITRNKAIDILRTQKYEQKTHADNDFTVTEESNDPLPEDVVVSTDSINRLVELISCMDEKYRSPLILQAKGYKLGEISRILEITEENVKIRLFRARKMAQNLLEEDKKHERHIDS